ncbi:MAG TPA: glycine betaine ABC transporter substrate-binding protein, partial [Paracoccaceae bacterium]|nr:glycine betaine ABC transporter substrate-binding protein [Paracoccaceae bacterium]
MKFATAAALAAMMIFSANAHADVVVGSKIDTEGNLLGNMIRIALEEGGIKTVDRISLGATPIVRQAILGG